MTAIIPTSAPHRFSEDLNYTQYADLVHPDADLQQFGIRRDADQGRETGGLGVDLRLLPFDADFDGLHFSHTVLNV